MSITAKSTGVNGLGILGLMSEEYGAILYPILEASPIYQTLDMEWNISGSYENATYVYDYDYTSTATQRVRESLRTSVGSYSVRVTSGGIGDALSADLGYANAPSTDKIHIGVAPSLYDNDYGHHSPLYQAIDIRGGSYEDLGAVVGTRTKKSDSSETDILLSITMFAPNFIVSTITGRTLVDLWKFVATNVEENVDITAWADSDWRDLRGTYVYDDTDANGIVTTFTTTIG